MEPSAEEPIINTINAVAPALVYMCPRVRKNGTYRMYRMNRFKFQSQLDRDMYTAVALIWNVSRQLAIRSRAPQRPADEMGAN